MDSVYQDFIKDYNNPNITAHDVRRINHLNTKQYRNIRETAIKNGDIPAVRHMNQTTAKFYSKKKDGSCEVKKTTNGKTLYVGRFPNESIARKVVNECIRCNWEINRIRTFIDDNKVKPKNYHLVNGYYIIQKKIKGVSKVFAAFPEDKVAEDTVKSIVDEFRRVNWDITCKDEVLSLFDI